MSINFKIYFKDLLNKDDRIVLLKGNLLQFKWNELKKKIIENSHNSYFESNNLALNNDNHFSLKIIVIEPPEIDLSKVIVIDNDISFSFLIETLKTYQDNNPIEGIKIKFSLQNIKDENMQQLGKLSKSIFLKETLQNVWKNEEKKIKTKLNEIELLESEISFLNKDINENKSELNADKNNNIICNECLSINFYGYRYICSYCDNYNLCYNCYKKDNHNKAHTFIVCRKPIKGENNINEYNNKINPNSFIFKNIIKSFEVDIQIANTGEKDLKNCYIGYIKYDENYLYCNKYTLGKLEKNKKDDIKLKIYFDKLDFINFNTFEGHFRMFNENGIPFGDILKIKVINEYALKIKSNSLENKM